MILTVIVFIVILVLLIFVHELGHFLVAKFTGVRVEEFAFGFPPRLFSIKRGDTQYSINAIPLGGYVKLFGEEGDENAGKTQETDPESDAVTETITEKITETVTQEITNDRVTLKIEETESLKVDVQNGSFAAKPVWVRISISVAGVIMNFILAIILMTIGFSIGMTPLVTDPAKLTGVKEPKVVVAYVQADSPAAKAGLNEGTVLNGFASTSDLQNFTQAHIGQTVQFSVTRQSRTDNIDITLSNTKDAPLGVSIISITKVKQPIFTAFWTSIKETGLVIKTFFVFLYDILRNVFTTGSAGAEGASVSGPVGLFNFTKEAIKFGWIYVLQLVILLSINLGIINILPFPALDGGKVLFLGLEGIFRKKVVRQEVENIIHLVGFALLIILMLAVTYRDIFSR